MDQWRRLFGVVMGRRLPLLDGELSAEGLDAPVAVYRDEFGVPHIDARSERDAWFGLGFCQGQDRGFQLETLIRMIRGTLAELVGGEGLATDRLNRRIGFRRVAQDQLAVLDDDIRQCMRGFADGVNAGIGVGSPRRPHELTLLRARPTRWDEADVLGMSKLFAFLMATNWDAELSRLRILLADGADAVAALDPTYAAWLPVTSPPGASAGPAADRLGRDLAGVFAGPGGGSNNWALAPRRTRTGRCLVANDPHLMPSLPPHFYLAHLRCPAFEAAGAALVGAFGIFAGHNDRAGWGVTVGMVDNTDLVIEELGPDGASVRRPDGFVSCEVVEETIAVKGAEPVVERVLITPEGPVIGPALGEGFETISIRATWLERRPIRGLLDLVKLRSLDDFRTRLGDWPSANQNVVFATTDGHIGWQLVGEAPLRRGGSGAFPGRGADPSTGWDDVVPVAEMPHTWNPERGWIATANNKPERDGDGPFVGNDFADGYRVARIGELLDARDDWDVADAQRMQLDVASLPWREMREVVLSAPAADPDGQRAQQLLASWDGELTPDSVAATAFELLLTALARRIVAIKAPNSVDYAMGKGPVELVPQSFFGIARSSQIVSLLREQPDDWPAEGWPQLCAGALADAGRALRQLGDDPAPRAWGAARPLRFLHPVGRPPLDRVFNLGPLPGSGDTNTISAAAAPLADPTGNPLFSPALRMTLDIGAWDRCRWALPGGQSGNPCSEHYDDQLSAWCDASGIPIAWTVDEVRRATRHALRLIPG